MSSSDEASRYLERQRQVASNVVTASSLLLQRRALKEGEWACIDAKCAHINSEWHTVCGRCGKGKPRSKNRVGREIGKDAAEKSKGLFAAEDWACTKCGNVNWARRIACNICNAPKLGDLEVRTGYGGGYMDRQNVEYIERKDEDEFDEFGRKKKKKRVDEELKTSEIASVEGSGMIQGDKVEDNIEEIDSENGEIDNSEISTRDKETVEEEEDESEEDLDKYDLSVDELEIERLKAKIAARKAALAASVTSLRAPSECSSECSCSCSGGECSCKDSEEEELIIKQSREHEVKKIDAEPAREIKDKSKVRDSRRSKERENRDRDRGRDERSERHRHSNRRSRSKSRDRSSKRHHHSSHRERGRNRR